MRKTVVLQTVLLSALLLSALSGTTYFSKVYASTEFIGIINSDTVWTKANSPYILTGPVAVNSGVTLTVEAGATVSGYYIQVNGTLKAIGLSTDPIHLECGIRFMQSSSSWSEQTETGCIIENAIVGYIDVNGASPKMSNNSINGMIIRGGSPTITNNNFTNHVYVYGGSPTISKNVITSPNDLPAILISDASAVMSNNTVYGGIEVSGSTIVANNTITHGSVGIDAKGNTSIFGNIIFGCTQAGIHAAGVGNGSVTIERNLITNNGFDGIHLSCNAIIQKNTIANNSVGISINFAPTATINYNNIQNNRENSITLAYTSNDVNATNNWWGTTDAQTINQTIFDGKRDFTLGTVNFIPYLTAPNPEAPAISPSSSPSTSPSPSPTIPEFPSWIILVFVAAISVSLAVPKAKKSNDKSRIKTLLPRAASEPS